MNCPVCNVEINGVDVVTSGKQKGILEGNTVVKYVEKTDRYGWALGECDFYCPQCGSEITSHIEG